MIALAKLDLDIDLRFGEIERQGRRRLALYSESPVAGISLLLRQIWFDRVNIPEKIISDEEYRANIVDLFRRAKNMLPPFKQPKAKAA